jgi:hypothetical protein
MFCERKYFQFACLAVTVHARGAVLRERSFQVVRPFSEPRLITMMGSTGKSHVFFAPNT